jgi:heme-degrading monooxygenase HmoA
MITSVHLADVSPGTLLSVLRRDPAPARVPGLRSGRVALATPLRTGLIPKLSRRIGLVAVWDDEVALDAFEATDPIAAAFAGGFRMRLAPLRAHGSWPGLDADVPKARRVEYDGPAAVFTLGRLRISQTVRFLRTSGKAEAATAHAPGMLWGTALVRPPFVATCSLWESSEAIAAYAFDSAGAPHPAAITAGRAKPFHHQEAFIRFRPVASAGSLAGSNPLAAGIRL